MNYPRLLALLSSAAFLAACGGGGGDDLTSQPVASAATFPLRSIQVAEFQSARSEKATGKITYKNGTVVAVSGTLTESAPYSGSFEGGPALIKYRTASLVLSDGTQSLPISQTGTAYFDSNYKYLGSKSETEYTVVFSITDYPASVKVNDTAITSKEYIYSDSSKKEYKGYYTKSFVIEADTANTAILKLIKNEYNSSGVNVTTGTDITRITTSGLWDHLSRVVIDYEDQSILEIQYP